MNESSKVNQQHAIQKKLQTRKSITNELIKFILVTKNWVFCFFFMALLGLFDLPTLCACQPTYQGP